MKHAVKYLVAALLITGCTSKNVNVEQLIEQKANTCPNCTIKVSDVTPFKWDELYVFNSTTQSKADIERAIQQKFDDYVPNTRPMIFYLDGKIVHVENNPDGLAKGTPGQIIFDYAPGMPFKFYNPQTAVFKVKTEKNTAKTFYTLVQQ